MRSALPYDKPIRNAVPHSWRYADLRPDLLRAGELTPIEKADVNTPAVFGNYVDIYDIAQAVEDGATLEDNAWIKGRAAASAAMLAAQGLVVSLACQDQVEAGRLERELEALGRVVRDEPGRPRAGKAQRLGDVGLREQRRAAQVLGLDAARDALHARRERVGAGRAGGGTLRSGLARPPRCGPCASRR